jgi:hypothetical protein
MADESVLDDFEADQALIEGEIESVTSAGGSTKLDSVDAKLMSLLSVRAYDSIVRKSQSIAKEWYRKHFESDLNELLLNRERIEQEFGTEADVGENWKIDLRAISGDDAVREITRLTRKLETVGKEIGELEIAVHAKRDRLELIRSQNERLTAIREGLENK